jgi:CheY-like chemotaxis protein
VVDAVGKATEGAATGRLTRVAASWLRTLGQDLSPAAAPLGASGSGWWRRAVLTCALVVLGLGTLDLFQHYRLGLGASATLGAARALPVLVCLYRPMAGWWLELAASGLTALVAQPVSASEPWPWPVTSVFALTVVLVMVGLRTPRRVLVELWLLLGVISAAAWLAVPDRRDWRGVSRTIVVSAVALLLADAVRARDQARRRLVEQEHVSETERARRLLLEERARIARELHDVVAHHLSVIAIQAEAAPHRVPDPPEELAASFSSIRANALEALTELRRVLGVLRAERGEDDTAPQPPGPHRRPGGRRPTRRPCRRDDGGGNLPAAAARCRAVGLSHRAGGAEQRHAPRPRVRGPCRDRVRARGAGPAGRQRTAPGGGLGDAGGVRGAPRGKAAEARPDVVLMDVRMPVMNGLQATRLIVGGGAPAPKVLVLTTFDLDEYVYEALRAGASGVLLKDSSGQQLAEAVRVVAAGEALLAPR